MHCSCYRPYTLDFLAGRHLAVSLDNGQIWAVNELGAALRAGDAVTIKRGALGSFLMKTPARRSYHARRIQ